MHNLIKYDRSLSNLLYNFERNINRLWRGIPLTRDFGKEMEMDYWLPPMDLKEENNNYIVRIDIPGVNVKDIKTSIDNQNNLIIEGEKETESKKEDKGYLCIERSKGCFYRKINLPHTVDANTIKAKYKDGVLEITVAQSKTEGTKQIKIETE